VRPRVHTWRQRDRCVVLAHQLGPGVIELNAAERGEVRRHGFYEERIVA
jgi:hypothetical protein